MHREALWRKHDDAGRESQHVNAVLLKRTHCAIGVNRECAEALSRQQKPTPVDPLFGAIARRNVVSGAIECQRMHIAHCALEEIDSECRRHGVGRPGLVHNVLHPLQHRFTDQGNLPLNIAGKGNKLPRRERRCMALECGDRWDGSVRDHFQ